VLFRSLDLNKGHSAALQGPADTGTRAANTRLVAAFLPEGALTLPKGMNNELNSDNLEAIFEALFPAEKPGSEPIGSRVQKFISPKESTYLDNFYYQVGTGNTSDAELLANASLYPLRDGSVYFKYPTNTYESLPNLLKQQGYSSYVFMSSRLPRYCVV